MLEHRFAVFYYISRPESGLRETNHIPPANVGVPSQTAGMRLKCDLKGNLV